MRIIFKGKLERTETSVFRGREDYSREYVQLFKNFLGKKSVTGS